MRPRLGWCDTSFTFSRQLDPRLPCRISREWGGLAPGTFPATIIEWEGLNSHRSKSGQDEVCEDIPA